MPKEQTMQQVAPQQGQSRHFTGPDRHMQMKQALTLLESENSQLKALVVRLSETVIRSVTAKR
jgi:hypothetical protein